MTFAPKPEISEDVERIDASANYDSKEFHMDPKGYFLIRINREKKIIEVGYCRQNNVILKLFTGKNAREICQAVMHSDVISRLDHAAYIGREAAKAEAALKSGAEYIQDTDIEF